ncbi:MAG: histidine triad nucleotide-binding protein [Oscillospiraceae bacterium]|jgi:histidine triad (HIT) family protein|nr:histidine triad nucleotide-binding protein [Oscillospiraceae bacterium]
MSDCIFCKIATGKIPSQKVYEDAEILAFRDLIPQAPTHILVIPKAHIASSAAEITAETAPIVGRIFAVIAQLAREQKLESYRIVNNCGEDAGQTVRHLHFHLLGGISLGAMLTGIQE